MVQRRNLIAHTHVSNLGVGEDVTMIVWVCVSLYDTVWHYTWCDRSTTAEAA